jgi:hypothetical protein
MITIGRTEVKAPAGRFSLRLVVDGSAVEAFVNGAMWITGRVYAARAAARVVGKASSLRVYDLA